jgi:beta-lactamase superfamily II metal-dependent hydrolase
MSYNGFEIFYQNLGNADSIYIRHWQNSVPTNILIDGGRKSHVEQIEKFLQERAKDSPECSSIIHHLICTHSDDDHAGGLVPLVENKKFHIGKAWVHDLRKTEFLPSSYRESLKRWGANKLLEKIESSEQSRLALLAALEARNIDCEDPYMGAQIGPMWVLGPTKEFFRDQYTQLIQEESAKSFESLLQSREVEQTYFTEAMQKQADATKDLGDGVTTPINEVSTIIILPTSNDGSGKFLFTGDVGPQGLDNVISNFSDIVSSLKWFDVPHHGSRRSMRQDQIDHLAPKVSFISAKGSAKHPSLKLVNALKKHGKVYSTHYSVDSSCWLRQSSGDVPPLKTVPATPLYEKN